MPKLRLAVACAVVLISATATGSSTAAGATPPDPTSNFAPDPSCSTPTSCLTQAIAVLNQARARLGEPGYRLPSNFAALNQPEQALVLTNLDRIHYGLQPITGLTADLDAAAATGVRLDRDPTTGVADLVAVASNWAGAYGDMPLAYESWMYADGPGSGNLDWVTAGGSGCWGHRQNILSTLGGPGALAMGAAAGTGSDGAPGYALLLIQGGSGYRPTYLYTWSQAVAAGAGGGASTATPAAPSRARIARSRFTIAALRVRGHSLRLRVLAPRGLRLSCALTRLSGRTRKDRYRHCDLAVTYRGLGTADYRLRVKGGARTLTRYLRVG